MTHGRLFLVGGHSRGVGKTALVVDLVRSLRARGRRVVTVKVSAHRHGSGLAVEEDGHRLAMSSTGRCRAAGASRALLYRCPDDELAAACAPIDELRDTGADVVVESNRLASWLDPDLTFFVVSAVTPDWKSSSATCLARADAIVLAPSCPGPPPRVWPHLRAHGGRSALLTFSNRWRVAGLQRWIDRGDQRCVRRRTKNTPSQTANSPASPNDSTRPPSAAHGRPSH